ncbi:MAG: response regulator, partial [Anaerolineales bacterium]|nr:response regulator [Anaerolineales bacterium]
FDRSNVGWIGNPTYFGWRWRPHYQIVFGINGAWRLFMGDGDKIRVLIVDDNAETRENIRKLLQFESNIEVVGTAKSGREAIQLSQEITPDVVLMDINMPDMDGIAATEEIRKHTPSIQVVILSVQGDQNYMRRAMLVGARDFLTKPPMPDDLTATIRRAGAVAREEREKRAQAYVTLAGGITQSLVGVRMTHGKIIMVYSPKGGTGCTTLAVNLALALHNDETRTMLVDANMQFGDVAVFMNVQGKNTILDLTPRADELDPDIIEEVMIKHAASGLHILAGPARPENAEKVTAGQFSQVLKYLRQLYAYVVVDTCTSLNDITLSVLDASDVIVLVATQEFPSIKNSRLFLDLMITMGIPLDKIAFVMNRYDKRNTITPEKVAENLKQEVVAVIPLDERVVISSVNRGVPFVLDNKARPSARGVFALAEALRVKLKDTKGVETEKVLRR